jgi:hypothetical protein
LIAKKIYDELNDDANALDCRLQAITSRYHPKPYDPSHPTTTTPLSAPPPSTPPSTSESDSDTTSSPDTKSDTTKNRFRKEMNIKEEVRLVLQLVTTYICKPDTPRNIKEREKTHLGREYLLLQVWTFPSARYIFYIHFFLSDPITLDTSHHPPILS